MILKEKMTYHIEIAGWPEHPGCPARPVHDKVSTANVIYIPTCYRLLLTSKNTENMLEKVVKALLQHSTN